MKLKYSLFFWILLIILFTAKIFYIGWGPLDISPDEAHYWDWSRKLDISYYSKGPFIAYNILLGVKLGEFLGFNPPNHGFWVRFPAAVNSIILGIIVWFLSNRIWNDKRKAFYIMLTLIAIPIFAVGSIIMTIDNPLMLFWALYLYLVFLALEKDTGVYSAPGCRSRIYWYLSGISLGLGFLSKYTMIILIPSIFLYLITTPKHRFWLRKKEFYSSLLIASIFFLPVLLWNMKYNWIGVKHLIGQAGLAKAKLENPFFLPHILEFILMQIGVVSPIIFILIILGFIKALILRKDYRYNFLFWFGVPLGVFYLILSLHEYCQANWPAPVYLTGALLTGGLFYGKRILKIGVGLGILMWLLVFNIDLLPTIPNRLDPTIRLRGWEGLGEGVGRVYDKFSSEGPLFIFSDTYQITSELAFYVHNKPRTYCVNLGRRMNQYDLWGGLSELIGYNGIYVKHRDQEIEPEIIDAFLSCEKLPLIEIRKDNRLIHQYSVFLCRGYKGIKGIGYEVTY